MPLDLNFRMRSPLPAFETRRWFTLKAPVRCAGSCGRELRAGSRALGPRPGTLATPEVFCERCGFLVIHPSAA